MTRKNSSLTKTEKKILKHIKQTKKNLFGRFPLLFTLLVAFGAAATFAGLNGIIHQIDILANNPVILLITGLLTLALTGKLYQKLG